MVEQEMVDVASMMELCQKLRRRLETLPAELREELPGPEGEAAAERLRGMIEHALADAEAKLTA